MRGILFDLGRKNPFFHTLYQKKEENKNIGDNCPFSLNAVKPENGASRASPDVRKDDEGSPN